MRPVLPGASTAFVLVTSRNQLPGLVALEGAHPVALGLLTDHDARELLERRLGRGRVESEPRAVSEIVRRCSRLPLALAIAAARAEHTGFALSEIALELADDNTGLDVLNGGEPLADVRTVFSWSYTALSPRAQSVFRGLGLAPATVSTWRPQRASRTRTCASSEPSSPS